MRIALTKVVEKHRDFKANLALQVTLAMGGTDEPALEVVVFTKFKALRLTLYKFVTSNLEPRDILIFLQLANTQALHCSMCPKNRDNLSYPHDERIKKINERVFSTFITLSWLKLYKLKLRIVVAPANLCCQVEIVYFSVRPNGLRMDSKSA